MSSGFVAMVRSAVDQAKDELEDLTVAAASLGDRREERAAAMRESFARLASLVGEDMAGSYRDQILEALAL